MVLLDDASIQSIRIKGITDPFVNLNSISGRIVVDNSMTRIASKSKWFCYCRLPAAEKLMKAVQYLPEHISFYIMEAYRPLSIQQRSVERTFSRYKREYPALDDAGVWEKVYEWVAPVNTAPHPTGGAIDVTLIDNNGNELDMGTPFNAEPGKVQNRTFTFSELVTGPERENRKILIRAMEQTGFVNYPTEWWHWSYGDKYWAFVSQTDALYSQVDETEIITNVKNG